VNTPTGSHRKVTIVGAGFSGLVSAYYLNRAGYNVEIFEKSSRVGGLIATRQARHGLVETAANAILNSVLVEELFQTLNIPLEGASADARKRFIFRNGRARRWPVGIGSTVRLLWFALRFAVARSSVEPKPGESIETWGHRVLGDEACRYLLSTALQGIYAGETSRISARLIVGRMFERNRNKRQAPRIKGSVAPREGMGQLIEALSKHLQSRGVQIHLNADVSPSSLPSSSNPVIIATSPSAASIYVHPEKADLLKQIEMRAVSTTTAFFNRTHERSRGFGVLFPPGEAKFLGVLKNSFIFSNRGGPHSETWIRAGTAPEGQILFDLLEERRRVFGIEENELEAVVTNWPEAIPHYTLTISS
jgi:protoporphyrinogen oxidase